MAWDFSTEPEFQEQLDWVAEFCRTEVEPLELVFPGAPYSRDPKARALADPLKQQVKDRGLWALFLDKELGGPGFGQLKLALLNEILGRYRSAPVVFGSQAPDTGNMEILAAYGTPEQKEVWLYPLMRQDIFSAYSMTEPEGGSDPTMFKTRAVRDGDEWVINGEKWFTSGGAHADIIIVMCVNGMFLVPRDTPGVEIMSYPQVHNHIRYTDVRVPAGNLLGPEDGARVLAQRRLGGGRIHHAMRTVAQVRLAFDMMCERALSRESHGKVVAEHQMVQEAIADSYAELNMLRLMVDIGPRAGEHGGHIVVSGPVADLLASKESLTGAYLTGRETIAVPASRRKRARGREVVVKGATAHNLKGVDVAFPLGCFIAVTGVSGSGKSTLVNDILYSALARELHGTRIVPGKHTRVTGMQQLDKVVHVDQGPIGRTPRSNPATYTGVFDSIRKLFAQTTEAKVRGYQPGRFSFNVKGGRCEACSGDGTIKIEMQFLPDVYVPCEVCHGARYNTDTLQVHYKGKTIADVLQMPIEEAAEFFEPIQSIYRHLKTLVDVGLGYVRLGQPAPTLSGGEAQRVKLAAELQRRSTGRTIYVLDEPTTGLHFDDIRKLLGVLGRLVEAGNTVIVIEHNLDVIKTADWVIDLGPDGGSRGGSVIATGTPEQVARVEDSYTGQFLKKLLNV